MVLELDWREPGYHGTPTTRTRSSRSFVLWARIRRAGSAPVGSSATLQKMEKIIAIRNFGASSTEPTFQQRAGTVGWFCNACEIRRQQCDWRQAWLPCEVVSRNAPPACATHMREPVAPNQRAGPDAADRYMRDHPKCSTTRSETCVGTLCLPNNEQSAVWLPKR